MSIEERVQQLYENVLELERHDKAERGRIEKLSRDWKWLGEREEGRQDWYRRSIRECNASLRGSWGALDAVSKSHVVELAALMARDGCVCWQTDELRRLTRDKLDRLAERGWLRAECKQAADTQLAAKELQVRQELFKLRQSKKAPVVSDDASSDNLLFFGLWAAGTVIAFFVVVPILNEPKSTADTVAALVFCVLLLGPLVAIHLSILLGFAAAIVWHTGKEAAGAWDRRQPLRSLLRIVSIVAAGLLCLAWWFIAAVFNDGTRYGY